MHTIHTEVEIDAAPDRVWAVLVDFASYPEWSTFIEEISGPQHVGARLRVRIQPPGGRGAVFRPTVRQFVPGRHLGWLGRLLIPGIFDGAHEFLLTPLPGGRTFLVHRETFGGIAVRALASTTSRAAEGFEAFNARLKARAEAHVRV